MCKLRESGMRVQTVAATQLFWDRMLDERDRKRLGNDLEDAQRRFSGPIRMWMHLRGLSQPRSIVEVAFGLNLLSEPDRNWLLREIREGEQTITDAIETAKQSRALVLIERQREAFWESKKIPVDWHKFSALWTFFGALARQARHNGVVDHTLFGENRNKDYASKTKHRLAGMDDFPDSLAGKIEPAGRGSVRLDLPSDQIKLFEVETYETLREVIG